MKVMLDAGLLHGDCMTITGKTVAENLKDIPPLRADQEVIRPVDQPDLRTRPPCHPEGQPQPGGLRGQDHGP